MIPAARLSVSSVSSVSGRAHCGRTDTYRHSTAHCRAAINATVMNATVMNTHATYTSTAASVGEGVSRNSSNTSDANDNGGSK